jgi:phosphoglycolate phosphatase-like HAD superfamily hydrolase
MKIKAILFDIIGTTVLEKDPNLINSCFENAFRQNNVKVEAAQIKANRGKDKSEIIKNILILSATSCQTNTRFIYKKC